VEVVEAWAGRTSFVDVLARARAGDDVAFSSLWHWLHPPLLRWLAIVAPDGGEDVAAEVWVSVIRGLDSFDGGEREFRGWVFTIARRRAIDWGRNRHRRPATIELDGVDLATVIDPGELIAGEVAVETAIALLRQLHPDQAEVVALRVIAGLTVPETAAIVNKSDGAVRVLCHRGLRALARRLQREMDRGVTR
jgi:RNA polymerase sigma-70 factor, ECF subfamily